MLKNVIPGIIEDTRKVIFIDSKVARNFLKTGKAHLSLRSHGHRFQYPSSCRMRTRDTIYI